MTRRLAAGVVGVAVAAAVIAPASASATTSPVAIAAGLCPGARIPPAVAGPGRTRVAVMCMINRFRVAHGRRPLRFNRQLARAAQAYSWRMATARFFSHTAPGGGSMVQRLRSSGYIRPRLRWSVGENLGWATDSLATPARMVQAWASSPGHRRVMLAPTYREAGIGVVAVAPSGASGGTYTMEFGARRL